MSSNDDKSLMSTKSVSIENNSKDFLINLKKKQYPQEKNK